MIYSLVKANQAAFPVRSLCRILGVSRSGYYDWRTRTPCKSSIENARLIEAIKHIHALSQGSYGMPRIHRELKSLGETISRKRVARLMRQAHIQGITRRRHVVTTCANRTARKAPDLVNRQFVATAINQLWVADITFLPTQQGFVYLAVVIDVFSRKGTSKNHFQELPAAQKYAYVLCSSKYIEKIEFQHMEKPF